MLSSDRIEWQHHGNGSVPLQPQVARAHIDRIIERAGEFLDALTGFRVDQGALIERARHRGRGDAGQVGNVLHL